MNGKERYNVNWTQRISVLLVLTILLSCIAGLASGRALPVSTAAQPELAALAAAHPDQSVRIIAQSNELDGAKNGRLAGLILDLGGTVINDLSMLNALSARMSAAAAAELARHPAVRWVSLDSPVVSTNGGGGGGCSGCPPNYFIDTVNVRPVWAMGLQGQGVTVAVVDSGFTNHADIKSNRILTSQNFNPNSVANVDGYGHGTHVTGIIAGNGSASGGFYSGIAPQVNLVILKISDNSGQAYESDTVAALQWALNNKSRYNIRVVNLSINAVDERSYHLDPLNAAVEILWFNGIVVVASAGNSGGLVGQNTIKAAPANDPFVITVGASDERGTASRSDDVIAGFSAAGITLNGFVKPDIIAPGRNIVSMMSNTTTWHNQYPERTIYIGNKAQYFRLSGTSMSAPMVAGAAALMIQHNPNLTPDQVKYRLMNSGSLIGGYRYLDIHAAVTNTSTLSANTGIQASQLLWTGSNPVNWGSVNWNSVNWNSVNWNSVNWNSVNWNSVNWNSTYWGE